MVTYSGGRTREEYIEYGKQLAKKNAEKKKKPRNINSQPLIVISYGIRKETIKEGGSIYADSEDRQYLKSSKKSVIIQGDQKTVSAALWESRKILCTLEPGWYAIQQHTNKLALGKNFIVERIKIEMNGRQKIAHIYGRGKDKHDWVFKNKLAVSTL